MTDDGVKNFSETLVALTSLHMVNLSFYGSQITDDGLYSLSEALKTMVSLDNINLNLGK